jgi:uncharacterized protein YdhG (YjbR/CyaY superfamily)
LHKLPLLVAFSTFFCRFCTELEGREEINLYYSLHLQKPTMANNMTSTPAATIDAYISGFPAPVQKVLKQIRATVRAAAPAAEEAIKYAMPTFMLNGKQLVLFAAFKKHFGFFPAPTGEPAFEKALAGYKTGKGSVQFPLDQEMPLALITRIVKHRIKKNVEAAKEKGKAK